MKAPDKMKKVPPNVKINADSFKMSLEAFGVLNKKEPVKYIKAPRPAYKSTSSPVLFC